MIVKQFRGQEDYYMGKHAYLIMAHGNFEYLKKLIESVDDPRNDVFVHIDKKANFTNFDMLKKDIHFSSIHYIKQRNVKWAGFSGILCEIDLLKAATEKARYDYYHLISGSDLVLKTQNEIHQFFDQNKGKEFVAFDDQEIDDIYLERVKYYYLFQDVYGRNRKNFFLLGLYLVDKILLTIQKILKVNRLKKVNLEFQKGTNWFSITHDFAVYVTQQERWINKTFKYSLSGDELFLQTILINSRFKENLCQPKNLKENPNMRLIDWSRGKPYTWRKEDYNILINSNMFYARKIDPYIDNDIITMIIKNLEK
ncbi:MAG: glycosyl transferase [Anaerolineaceae bacterium]|nr:MAG: glycosyl transferase [Anaerolineaceae bacterium]